ncbi:hypothetical protein SADUNF_Sadunf15G0083000 [Salix dunnii]|uniref:Pentatricopeptide repeat-containing protein n=1 Tax=Salix dunnii TaxID=1413687 RepID=A0A835MIR2_9ROSI|nr:hypothetical protein SADUNF_Sadunf15G0083000 [Salix dunnii]
MEVPLLRFQSLKPDQIQNHNNCNFPSLLSMSKCLKQRILFSGYGFSFNKTKWKKNPFSKIKCCSLDQGLQPRPKLKPAKVDIDVSGRSNFVRRPSVGLCSQIEKLVLFARYREALDLFEIFEIEGGFDVGISTYDALVNACIGLRSVRGVKRVFNYMISNGFEFDQYMRNRVLLMHVKCGMMIDARRLFDEMPERNLVSWNTIISGLVGVGDFMEAFRLFLIMWEEFLDAGSFTFAVMIRASSGLELISIGRQLHACTLKMGIGDDIFVSCALIDMYSKCGSIEDARFVFEDMPEKTTVGWNTIIAGYALHGYSEEALDMYYEMRDSGVRMDHFTFSMIVRICASVIEADRGNSSLIKNKARDGELKVNAEGGNKRRKKAKSLGNGSNDRSSKRVAQMEKDVETTGSSEKSSSKDDFPRLKAMPLSMANQESTGGIYPVAVINMKKLRLCSVQLQNDEQSKSEVMFR